MQIRNLVAKINEQEIGFQDIGIGEFFIMLSPPTIWERLKGVIMIKIASNRVQQFDDSNLRLTVKSAVGPVNKVSIHESN